MRLKRLILFALLSLFSTPYLFAQENFKLSGFGSLGVVTTNSEQAGFRRDNADKEQTRDGEINLNSLSLLGLQSNYRFAPNLEIVGQALLRDHPTQNIDNILRIASINYEPLPDWQIRLGRVSQRTFLLSDSRPIGFSNIWTMPVQEFYSLLISSYIEGLDTTYSVAVGPGYLRAYGNFGRTTVYLQEPGLGTTKLELSRATELNLEYELTDWAARVSWAQAIQDNNLDSLQILIDGLTGFSEQLGWQEGFTLASALDTTDKQIEFISAALTYNDGNINFKSELGRLQSEARSVDRVNSAYISLGKTVDRFTPFVLIGYVKSDTSGPPEIVAPIQTPELNQLLAGISARLSAGFDQKSIGIGIRYDINSYSSIKAQWEHKQIGENGYNLWAPDSNFQYPNRDENLDVLSVRLDFIF